MVKKGKSFSPEFKLAAVWSVTEEVLSVVY